MWGAAIPAVNSCCTCSRVTASARRRYSGVPELFAHKDATNRSGRRPAAVTRSLPDHPRARAERAHAALPETGAAENLDLTEVLSEIRGWTMRRAHDSRARFHENRQRGQQISKTLRPGTSQNRE